MSTLKSMLLKWILLALLPIVFLTISIAFGNLNISLLNPLNWKDWLRFGASIWSLLVAWLLMCEVTLK